MISYLKGTIKYLGSNWLILDVNGVGYKVFINFKLNENLAYRQAGCKLEIENSLEAYIYQHIREDRQELYGFETMEELQMFELLISVSGVGPKMGMNILSTFNSSKITKIIVDSDSTLLTSVPGVGKKLAMKIIIELKSKLDSGAISCFGDFDNLSQELLDALESLGYKKHEITPLVAKIPEELTSVQEKIKWILKQKK